MRISCAVYAGTPYLWKVYDSDSAGRKDRFSEEIFVNDGEQVISSAIYTPLEAESIFFEANGMAIIDVEKYDIVIPDSPAESFSAVRCAVIAPATKYS